MLMMEKAMDEFENLSNEDIKQQLEEMLLSHNSFLAQINHTDTPERLRLEFRRLDKDLNVQFVRMGNYLYRKTNLRYNIPTGSWDKIHDN